jgi:chorismate lyase / 3-hydroxybenzoate synthase
VTVPVSTPGAARGPALRVSRHPGAPIAVSPDTLGTLLYGGPAGDVPAPLLQPAAAHDAWHTDAPVQRGQHGRLRWARSAQWCWGAIDCDAWDDRRATPPDALADAAQSLYRELLDFLHTTDAPHLLRLWNYLPHINRVDGGLERYRHFNLGRQRALLARWARPAAR